MSERPLILIGGTGRSGTHVLARLLGRHPQLADVPIEARFHCHGPKGFPDLLAGRATLDEFVWKLREFWWHRVRKEDFEPRGLYNISSRRRFDSALAAFEPAFRGDQLVACRRLFWDPRGPLALYPHFEYRPGQPRVSDSTAFFYMGELVEFDKTDVLFTKPSNPRTEDYIHGRFG